MLMRTRFDVVSVGNNVMFISEFRGLIQDDHVSAIETRKILQVIEYEARPSHEVTPASGMISGQKRQGEHHQRVVFRWLRRDSSSFRSHCSNTRHECPCREVIPFSFFPLLEGDGMMTFSDLEPIVEFLHRAEGLVGFVVVHGTDPVDRPPGLHFILGDFRCFGTAPV